MSQKMQPDDPAYWMLLDDFVSIPEVYLPGCYICEDPEFAQMGLPLCKECPYCVINCNNCSGVDPASCVMQRTDHGHVPADDEICDSCQQSVNPYNNPDEEEEPPF